jgi:hypothetical protein
MRRFIALATLVIAASTLAVAQNGSKLDVFGGFSVLNTDSPNSSGRDSFYGWQASATGYLKPWFGLVADFGGQYKTYNAVPNPPGGVTSVDVSSYEYLFGPQVDFRAKVVTLFAHFLAGGIHQNAGIAVFPGGALDVSANGFSMGIGGGMDVNVSRHFAIRVIQVDWLPARIQGDWATDAVRIGFGAVLRVGH